MGGTYSDPSGDPNYPPPPAGANPYPNPYDAPPQYGYSPPPAYGQPPPAYGQPPPAYGQPPPPYGQPPPAYATPQYNAYGYPAPPRTRPGQVLAAGVLAYVLAGILILSGLLLLFGASSVHSLGNSFNSDTSSATAELAFDGFVDLVAAGLLIAGGVSLSGAHRRGRTLLLAGTGMTLADCVYWLARTSADGGVFIFIIVYGGLAALAMVFALSGQATQWLNTAPAAPPAYRG